MQCPSCQFENMPGTINCGRCGAQLRLASATMDVNPPRASARAKRWRQWFPWYRLAAEARGTLGRVTTVLHWDFDWDRLPRGVLARLVVPGWPQRYLGHLGRGRIMLRLYVALLAVGLLFIGTTLGAWALGAAVAVHFSSALDALWPFGRGWRTRLVVSVASCAVLFTILYAPVAWAATRVVGVRRMTLDAEPLRAGDVILFLPGGSPDVGDTVLYQIEPGRVQTHTVTGYQALYYFGGEFIDRIVAGPGQTVTWERQEVLVDGQRSLRQPLHPASAHADVQFTVPAGCYGILPTVLPEGAPGFPPDVLRAASIVPAQRIVGTILLRRRSFWRWGRL